MMSKFSFVLGLVFYSYLPATWGTAVASIRGSSIITTISHVTSSPAITHHRHRAATNWASTHSKWLCVQNRSSCYFVAIDLASIHVFHCILGIIRIEILDVTKSTSILWMESISWEFNVFDLSVTAENLNDMFFSDVTC